jgi:ubiquinone/menaquinone biosynthesis C-methylase UbiE
MSKLSDPKYLLREQYQNASNLNARLQLHDRFSTNKYGWHLWVFDQFNLSPKSRILELGCGAGTLWLKNIHRISDDWDIILSDISLGMLEDAQRNLRASQQHFKFATVDAQSIPFEDKSFDAVIANHILYHVPDMTKAFSEVSRVLKPGGRFYASTNGRNHLREFGELVRRFEPNITFKVWDRPFSLENGLDELSQWFSKVNLRKYEDSLAITEVDPLVAYVLSSISNAKSVLVGDKLVEFINFVKQELTLHGVISVTKDAGIFEACRDNCV